MKRIFISYSSKDRSMVVELAKALAELLEFTVWFDQELIGGTQWWDAILDAIDGCDVFVIALSQNYLHSIPCEREYSYAYEVRRPILPITIARDFDFNSLPSVIQLIHSVAYIAKNIEELTQINRAIKAAPRVDLPTLMPPRPEAPIKPQSSFSVNRAYQQPVAEIRRVDVPSSRMFVMGDALQEYKRKHGADAIIYDMADGDTGKSLPGVPAAVFRQAMEIQERIGSGYSAPSGSQLFRESATRDYWKLDKSTGWGPENIVFVQGGRDGLAKAYDAVLILSEARYGDMIITPRIPWMSYLWGPISAGLNTIIAPGSHENKWKITAKGLEDAFRLAESAGTRALCPIITSPDNPTGSYYSLDEQIDLAKAALAVGYSFVLLDWTYHWFASSGPFDLNRFLSAFKPEQREKLIILDSLTKSLGASNIRSAHLLCGKQVAKYIIMRSSHAVIPSFFAQAVAIAAYQTGFALASAAITEPTKQSRVALRSRLEQTNIPFICDEGCYAFLDLSSYIAAANMGDSEDLVLYLASNYGVAVVSGGYFSHSASNWVRFTYAHPPDVTIAAFERLMEGLNALTK